MSQKNHFCAKELLFSKTFSHFLSINSNTVSKITNSHISRSLDTAIVINADDLPAKEYEEETYHNISLALETDKTIITNCIFELCWSTEQPGAIKSHSNSASEASLIIRECRFLYCLTLTDAAILQFEGYIFVFEKNCAAACKALFRGQTFVAHHSNYGNTTMNHFYLCGPKQAPGTNDILSMNTGNITFVNNNISNCHLKELRALGDFSRMSSLQYQYNLNINGSGRTYLGFGIIESTQYYLIADSVFVKCLPFANYIVSMIEVQMNITIQRFALWKTKMAFVISPKSYDMLNIHCTFVDCVTDGKEPKEDARVTIINMTYKKENYTIPRQEVDFKEWKCKTFLPSTPLPTQTATFMPTASPSPWPSMSLAPLVEMSQEVEQPPIEQILPDGNRITTKLTRAEIIELGVLLVLSLLTIFVFLLAKKKPKATFKAPVDRIAEENEETKQFLH